MMHDPPDAGAGHNTVNASSGSVGVNHGTVIIHNDGTPAPAPDVRAVLDEGAARYSRRIRRAAIMGRTIPRAEAQAVIETLEDPDEARRQAIVVAGSAGAGKSSVIAQVVDHCVARGWPILALRMDELEPQRTLPGLGAALGLNADPIAALLGVAGGRRCLVVVDQLDAVSETSGRRPEFFERVAELTDALGAHDTLHMVLGCRAFDLEHDHRIRRLVGPRGVAARVDVKLLDEATVRDVVARAGRRPDTLTPKQVRLLRVPIHLMLWTDLPADLALVDIDTGRGLLDAYWRHKVRRLDRGHEALRERWRTLLDDVLDYMGEHRVPSAPAGRFELADPDALSILLSEHVLTRAETTGDRLAFAHETLFDDIFARRFIARGRSLVDFVLQGEQHLALRTTVRQVLQHMRGGESEVGAYHAALRTLLLHPEVRFHIKHVVLAWLGALPDPRRAEWAIICDGASAAAGSAVEQWIRPTLSGPWFELLAGIGYIEAELAADDVDRVDGAVRRLVAAARHRPALVVPLVEGWGIRPAPWPDRLARVVAAARGFAHDRWPDLYMHLARNAPATVKRHLVRPGSLFFWHMPQKAPLRAIDIARFELGEALDRVWRRADRSGSGAGWFRADLRLRHLSSNWTWDGLARAAPAAFCARILPLVLHGVRAACPRGFIRPHREIGRRSRSRAEAPPLIDDLWGWPRGDDSFSQTWPVVRATATALSALADQDAEAFDAAIDLLVQHSTFHTAGVLLLWALTSAPARADDTVKLMLSCPSLLEVGYQDASHGVSREAVEAIGSRCSPAAYARLEAGLLELTPAFERRYRRRSGQQWYASDGRPRWAPHLSLLGRAQFTLLNALPRARLSTAAKRRLGEFRRRFGRRDARGPRRSKRMLTPVPAPIEARWERMTDAQWLSAMRRHGTSDPDDRWGEVGLRGGAWQLARELEKCVELEPARFAALLARLPDGLHEAYPSAILRGLVKADGPDRPGTEFVWQAARRVHALGGRPCGQLIARLIERYANAAVPDDVLNLIAWHATDDPDPPADTGAGDAPSDQGQGADIQGLNTVRGSVCHALGALLRHDGSRIEHLRPAVEHLVDDPSVAVRTQVPRALLPLLGIDPAAAVQGFLDLCAPEHPAAAVSLAAQDFWHYTGYRYFDTLEPLAERMLTSPHDALRRQAASRLAAAVYQELRAVERMRTLWADGDAVVRAALADLAAHVVRDARPSRRALAVEILERSFHEAERAIIEAATRCFHLLAPDEDRASAPLTPLAGLFEAFIDSPAFRVDPGPLLHLLEVSHERLPDVVLRVFDRVLADPGCEAPLFETSLIYRLYEDSDSPETKARCLNLIDALLERGDHGLQRTLDSLDTAGVADRP